MKRFEIRYNPFSNRIHFRQENNIDGSDSVEWIELENDSSFLKYQNRRCIFENCAEDIVELINRFINTSDALVIEFIGTEEDAVPGFVNGHASSAVDAQGLLAAKKLDALVLKRRDNVLCFLIGSEDSHVSAAVDAELLGEDGEVHRIAAGVHGLDVLVLIDDIVSKAEHAYRIGCHG